MKVVTLTINPALDKSAKMFAGLHYVNLIHPKWDSIRNSSQFKVAINSLSVND